MKCNLENPKNEVAQKITRTDGETGQYVNKTAVTFGFTFLKSCTEIMLFDDKGAL